MKKNKKPYKLLALALALAFSSSSVHALVIDATVSGGTTLLSNGNRNVSDNNTVPDSDNQVTSLSISKFDSSNGVLLGVTATLTPGNSSTFLRADGGTNTMGKATASATWTGSAESGLNTGVQEINAVTKGVGNDAGDKTWNSVSQNITNGADLNNWLGTGNLSTTVNTTLTADRTSDGGSFEARIGDSADNNDSDLKNLTATYQVTYTYLEHAAASFDGSGNQTVLNLNFGDVFVDDAVGSLAFSLFNLTGDRVELDLNSITGSGDTLALTTNLAAFSDLAAGNSFDFLASINTDNAGSFSATYYLSLSDANVGASSSRYAFNDYLTLNLTGNVIERSSIAQVNDVPEPGLLALMSIGLFSLLGLARRKQQVSI